MDAPLWSPTYFIPKWTLHSVKFPKINNLLALLAFVILLEISTKYLFIVFKKCNVKYKYEKKDVVSTWQRPEIYNRILRGIKWLVKLSFQLLHWFSSAEGFFMPLDALQQTSGPSQVGTTPFYIYIYIYIYMLNLWLTAPKGATPIN